MTDFRLQILHTSDLEGGVDAIGDAPNFAAIVDNLEESVDNTIILSAGDNFLSGPFFNAAGDRATFRDSGLFNDIYNQLFGLPNDRVNDTYGGLTEGGGRVDISIMNIIGFDASAIGNHEFDLGSDTFEGIIEPDFRDAGLGDDRWVGTGFPYLSANLDFSADSDLFNLFTEEILPNTAFQTSPVESLAGTTTPKIAPATIIEEGGEKIGVVGATTQLLESISSPTGTTVQGTKSNDMDALAAILQPVVDKLKAEGINKIILVSHLQQISLEQELITKLSGVDVVVAGGSDTILANDDSLRPQDTPANTYPIVTTNADGDPAVIVSTDGEYSYVGRLVVDFDANGILVNANGTPLDNVNDLDLTINRPIATIDEEVTALWGSTDAAFAEGTKGNQVKQLTDAVEELVATQDGNVFGQTEVFIEGRREQVRTEETTLGNLSADANLAFAQTLDSTVQVSLKNGGGIRAAIGEVDADGTLLPPQDNPISGKQTGEISQLDIVNTLRFNNGLSLLTVTAQEFEQIIEYGVAATADGATPGQFPQVSGINFSFDPSLQPIVFQRDADGNVTGVETDGDRIRSLAIVDDNGEILDVIVENGELVGDANRPIRLVTLDFLAGGGDNYPFPEFGENRVDLTQPNDAPRTGNATFAADGSEQDALAEFLVENFPVDGNISFNAVETSPESDTRIQNLSFREDMVLDNQTTPTATPLIFDDDGSQDGMTALAFMLANPKFDIQAITIAQGIARPEIFDDNLARMLGRLGRTDIPIGVGRPDPLAGNNVFPDFIRDGSDTFWAPFVTLPEETPAIETRNAAELIVEKVNQSPEPVAILATGPLTNIAEALRLDPSIIDNISVVQIMGGAVFVPGNLPILPDPPFATNEVAEFNIWIDPVAAQEVFAAGEQGLNIQLTPLDATNKIEFDRQDLQAWLATRTPESEIAAEFLDFALTVIESENDPNPVWDLVAAINLSEPDFDAETPLHIQVDTESDPGDTQGQTVAVPDLPPNVLVSLNPSFDNIDFDASEIFLATSTETGDQPATFETLVSGTPGEDILVAGNQPDFDGFKDTIFAGADNDIIELNIFSSFAGRNRVNAGSGDDEIFVSKGDRVFGGAGNDEFDATDSQGGNRMSGGPGDDTFFLGSNDRALGRDGDDIFYVQSGGDNLLSGGAGADQFWIVSGEIPSATNTILDFEEGVDVIGILGAASLGITADTLNLNEVSGNTEIGFGGQTLAILNGVTGLDVNTSVVFA
ncbi:MAG: nucleoside hydrolase [Nostocaceae cyanobacterium]|nr:nucleoside hydrolase [Nostocaceae cyanobacterium]